jgi:hypothetical protein
VPVAKEFSGPDGPPDAAPDGAADTRSPPWPGMSLATTTAGLEVQWRRRLHDHPPRQRWADQHPVLDTDLDELRDRLADRDRDRSGPTLAALVQLARDGDNDAALLVTLALLPRMVNVEARYGEHRGYDELAGHLWEAVVTASNPQTRCLRECIERNVWRRHRRYRRSPKTTVPVNIGVDPRRRRYPYAEAAPDSTEDDALAGHQAHAMLEQLTTTGTISPAAARLLEHLAADTDYRRVGQSQEAARKQRWRTTSGLRAIPGLHEQLAA